MGELGGSHARCTHVETKRICYVPLFKVDERETNSGDSVRLFNRERARVTSVSHALHVIKPTEPI